MVKEKAAETIPSRRRFEGSGGKIEGGLVILAELYETESAAEKKVMQGRKAGQGESSRRLSRKRPSCGGGEREPS